MTRRASCACEALTLSCDGAPSRVSICYCLACQQRTGSAFGIQARFEKSAVKADGPESVFERTGDSGGRVTMHFCPACGSTVYWEIDTLPDVVAVAVGAFADPDFAPPTVTVYEARKHAWMPIPESVVDHHD